MTLYDDAPTSVEVSVSIVLDADDFIVSVYRRLCDLGSGSSLTTHDAEDAVHRCIVKLLTDLEVLRARYGTTAGVARALWASGPSDHRRAERIQQALGAQLKDDADGTRVARRRTEALHDPSIEKAVTTVEQRQTSDAYDRIDDLDELRNLIGPLSALVRKLLWLVHVEGFTVTEAAEMSQCSRGHASRLLSGVRSQLENLAQAA